MKKVFFILLAIGMTFYMVSTVSATSDKGVCTGLKGAAFGLCNSYCNAPENDCVMNPNTAICEDLRKNNEKINGSRYFPCDELIACALCGDPNPDNFLEVIGECAEVLPFECMEPQINAGAVTCDQVSIPAALDPANTAGVGCDNINPNNALGVAFYPDCQNGMPAWVCSMFLGGTPLPAGVGCPAPPSCFE